jgi:hypothetical protein
MKVHFRNSQKPETLICSSSDEQINKMWYIHTMKYYLALKRIEVLLPATK